MRTLPLLPLSVLVPWVSALQAHVGVWFESPIIR